MALGDRAFYINKRPSQQTPRQDSRTPDWSQPRGRRAERTRGIPFANPRVSPSAIDINIYRSGIAITYSRLVFPVKTGHHSASPWKSTLPGELSKNDVYRLNYRRLMKRVLFARKTPDSPFNFL